MAQGLDRIPLRIPEVWSARWFETFVRDVLAKADIRNAVPGLGISIDGQSDQPATVSSSEDIQAIFDADLLLAEANALLPNARILAGESSVVSLSDEGPGGSILVGLNAHGVDSGKFREAVALSVVGNPTAGMDSVQDIDATANDQVLRRVADVLEFGAVTFPMVQVSAASLLLGRGDSGAGDMQEITLGYGLAIVGAALSATYPPVVSESGSNLDASASNAGNYTRFSNATATYTFNNSAGFVVGAEYYGRYVGSGNLTITPAGAMTINAPAGGTLVIPPQGTFTVKIVGAAEADLYGVTT